MDALCRNRIRKPTTNMITIEIAAIHIGHGATTLRVSVNNRTIAQNLQPKAARELAESCRLTCEAIGFETVLHEFGTPIRPVI